MESNEQVEVPQLISQTKNDLLIRVGEFELNSNQYQTYGLLTQSEDYGHIEILDLFGSQTMAFRTKDNSLVDLDAVLNGTIRLGKVCRIGKITMKYGGCYIDDQAWLCDGVILHGFNNIGKDAYLREGVELYDGVDIPNYFAISAGRKIVGLIEGKAADHNWIGYKTADPKLYLQVGCQDHTLEHWRDNVEEILDEQGEPGRLAQPLLKLTEFIEAIFK